MAGINVRLDFREVRGKLWDIRNKLISTTNNPDIKTNIYQYIYDNYVSLGVPLDTGALEDSPKQEFSRSTEYKKHRYANGGIGPDGIVFDPIQKTKKGYKHYGRVVMIKTDWSPYAQMRNNMDDIMDYIKEVMVKELNNG